jgi:hypothetical protein
MKDKKKNYFWIIAIFLIIIFGIILVSNSDNTKISYNGDNNQESIPTQNNQIENSQSDNYCFNIENEVWQNRCLAYKNKDASLCEAFYNGNPSGQEDIDECHYSISINTGGNGCVNIEDKKLRWKCEAITNKDMNQCAYSIDLESEVWCLREYSRFYEDEKACNLIGDKEEELIEKGFIDSAGNLNAGLSEDDCLNSLNTIEESSKRTEEETIIAIYGNSCKSEYNNQDCSTYEDEWEESDCLLCQAMNNKEPNKCLLIKNNRRDNCILALSLLTNDVLFCQERSDESHINSCIEQYARNIDINVCLNPVNSNCIISAVEEMDETNQNINSSVCSSIKNINDQGNCYVEYAKSSV